MFCLNIIILLQNNHDIESPTWLEKMHHELVYIYQLWEDDFENVRDIYDLQDFESLFLGDIEHCQSLIKRRVSINNRQIKEYKKEISQARIKSNGNYWGLLRKRDKILQQGRIEGEYVKACKRLIIAEYENKKFRYDIRECQEMIRYFQKENKQIKKLQKQLQEEI